MVRAWLILEPTAGLNAIHAGIITLSRTHIRALAQADLQRLPLRQSADYF